eukprot:CAMPEP_0177579776 /NCGR_PEP_ID=MMETSP0419_2-20121207/1158_1 /TAXON_ID=582737 /ORGANISM="Tetraselmis sp., Strain GSL018" /LENGTH=162 /DNA_ID=CAMNT_0019068501 /DNA_START=332 /DNA_END=820 /DNA_ORIENTATION=-
MAFQLRHEAIGMWENWLTRSSSGSSGPILSCPSGLHVSKVIAYRHSQSPHTVENIQLVCSDGRLTPLCLEDFRGHDLVASSSPTLPSAPEGVAVRVDSSKGYISDIGVQVDRSLTWVVSGETVQPSESRENEYSVSSHFGHLRGLQCRAVPGTGLMDVRFHT